MKSAIITGPTGAIGSALTRALVNKGIKVYAVCRPGSKRLDNLPQSELLQIVESDVSDLRSVADKITEKVDVFYHFAWAGTFGDVRNNMPLQVQNIQYTLDAVELAHSLQCNTFVGAGSQAEYGRVEGMLNGSVVTNPENGYGMAKLSAGQMSRVVCQRYGIKHIWTRILSVYGPFDGEYTMVMSTIGKLLRGEKPSFTKGEQQWDYLYSVDAAGMMIAVAERGKDGSIYCFGSGQAKPLKDYITTIQKYTNPQAELGLGDVPYSEKQVMFLCADISDLQNDTGFECKYNFEEGIQETIKWYQENRL
ncbi:NAD(P)-dependent oxidoreductase [Bacteroides sp.]|uniref:NAD-dependent epimerase/dehydratase family protein n=1 Tax=Bacteroides sp. TaxID=29523 RepID=UPI0026362F11|nr:NAD(P)-dependent oxidoreductase [Bacteroides sp.]MDD3040494.1 NAD(P)-dependent oxidoreductase [Bacteroides sp.]